MSDRLLSPVDASEKLGIAVSTLARWRKLNRGPKFRKVSGDAGARGGRIRYSIKSVDDWLASRPEGGSGVTA